MGNELNCNQALLLLNGGNVVYHLYHFGIELSNAGHTIYADTPTTYIIHLLASVIQSVLLLYFV